VRRDELRRRIDATRSEVARLARTLPKEGPEQTAADANAKWHLERAEAALQMASDQFAEAGRRGGADR
jgi:hypothetical protein